MGRATFMRALQELEVALAVLTAGDDRTVQHQGAANERGRDGGQLRWWSRVSEVSDLI